jgi:hypothetical protein
VLHGRRIDGCADRLEERAARLAIVAEHADLDELVGAQRAVDLVHHRGRQALLPDRDDGIEVVRAGTQGAARGGVERRHGRSVPPAPAATIGQP